MTSNLRLILASQSPRRSQLLQQMGLAFETLPADIDETAYTDEAPANYVQRLAETKAQAQWRAGCLSLGADTTVVIDDALLGKPENEQHCVDMLLRLSGRTHNVFTGIALFNGVKTWSEVVVSAVTLRTISADEARAYWVTGEPCDKAGAYALQGLGGIFVDRVDGSPSGVIGLPMAQTQLLLRAAGFDIWKEQHHG